MADIKLLLEVSELLGRTLCKNLFFLIDFILR